MKNCGKLFICLLVMVNLNTKGLSQTDQSENIESYSFDYVLKLKPQYQEVKNWSKEVTETANSHFEYLKIQNAEGKWFCGAHRLSGR